MIRLSWLSRSEDATLRFGAALGRALDAPAWVGLTGPLGAGKTRLAQGVARGLDVPGKVRSPSFVIEHRYRGRFPVRHLDLYRLENAPEDIAASWEENRERAVVLVEWAERVDAPPAGCIRLGILPVAAREGDRWIVLEWDPVDSPLRNLRLEGLLGGDARRGDDGDQARPGGEAERSERPAAAPARGPGGAREPRSAP